MKMTFRLFRSVFMFQRKKKKFHLSYELLKGIVERIFYDTGNFDHVTSSKKKINV